MGGFVGAAMLEVLEVIAVLQWEIACIQMCVMCDVCWCCVDGEVEKTEYGTRGAGGQGGRGAGGGGGMEREKGGGGGKGWFMCEIDAIGRSSSIPVTDTETGRRGFNMC